MRFYTFFSYCVIVYFTFGFTSKMDAQKLLDSLIHPNTIYDVEVSHDAAKIFTAGKDSIARIWNLNGSLMTELKLHKNSPVSSINYHEKYKTILTSDYLGNLFLSNLKGKLQNKFIGHTNGIIKITQKGKYIGSASRDKTAKVWNRKGRLILTLKGHSKQVNDIKFLLKKKLIITAGWDAKINIWDFNGNLIKSITPHKSGIRCIVISQKYKHIISGHRDGVITIVNFNGDLIRKINAHKSMIFDVELMEDRDQFISASDDKYISIWNMNGEQHNTFLAHSSYVSGLSYSKKKNILISSSGFPDKTVKIWRLFED